MTRNNWIAIGLAYIVGLWSTSAIDYHLGSLSRSQLGLLLSILLGLTGLAMRVRQWRGQVRNGVTAILVAAFAVGYLQLRTPQPLDNDVSYQVVRGERSLVTLTGKVLTEPRLSDRQTLKFLLAASSIVDSGEEVSGKLYTTLPLLQGTGIFPGQELSLTGYLYLPRSAIDADSFDFQQYLARQGVFAGFQGKSADFEPMQFFWSWSQLRRRIVRIHLRGLGSPRGQLVSSMVLGRKAVDLDSQIRGRFMVSGLAHVLAASGFHVSLLLGIILWLTTRMAAKPRLLVGLITLSVYLGLTGMQASVMRACLMGIGVLLAITLDTKVKPLGSLLMAAVIILLFDPLLITDLGFKLSFLATFGLIVTLPALQTKLDWLPSTVATLVAIPLAASVWVLPLVSYEFNSIATYSLVVNIICTPLIILISLGGMVSAIAGLIIPMLGSAIASLLYYPTGLLIAITQFCSALPGSSWSVGQIPAGVLLAIYGLFVLIWRHQWWQKRWWLGLSLPIILALLTIIQNATLVQVSVLATHNVPIVAIRDRGRVILINSGRESQAKYAVLPFLAQQGINHIDYGVASDRRFNSPTAWKKIASRVRVGSIYQDILGGNLFEFKIESRPLSETISTKSIRLRVDRELNLVELQTENNTWLVLNRPNLLTGDRFKQYIQENLDSQKLTVIWSGEVGWLEQLQPQMAISTDPNISPETENIFQQRQIEYYNTALEGTISWTDDRYLNKNNNF